MEHKIRCPVCKEICEFVNSRLFELRVKSPRLTAEKKSLSHIELILHEADEKKYKVTIKTGTSTREE